MFYFTFILFYCSCAKRFTEDMTKHGSVVSCTR